MSASALRRSRTTRVALVVMIVAGCAIASARAADAGKYGLGRAPTPAEIQRWNIDVRPDFAGLPRGSGSVERGQALWDANCASCHGVFGESNEFFNPIIGGTTPDDAKSGVVKSLTTSELQRTTMMKLSSLATMWDYIRRAMPWNAPKSLSDDDVYALTAYILHLADLVPAGFVLSEANIRDAEQKLPNHNGMTRDHGMWDLRGKPDVRNAACMKNCDPAVTINSAIPDHARNAHGNLAEQNRPLGGVRGIDTTRPMLAGAAPVAAARTTNAAVRPVGAAPPVLALATRHGCMACHGVDKKIIGPAFKDIAARHAPDAGGANLLAERIRGGGSGQWGTIPMPPQSQVSPADANALAAWIAAGASSK